jgi:hypothetical protein
MDASKISESGILKKGEEIAEHVDCRFKAPLRNLAGNVRFAFVSGSLVITNKRLFFVQKPGWRSRGLNMLFHCSLGDILSVSATGLISKQLNVSVPGTEKTEIAQFPCKNAQLFAEKLIEHKNKFVEEKTIEAKRVIIEEGKKDSATEVLQKRLARGEITLEEFHKKVQRT